MLHSVTVGLARSRQMLHVRRLQFARNRKHETCHCSDAAHRVIMPVSYAGTAALKLVTTQDMPSHMKSSKERECWRTGALVTGLSKNQSPWATSFSGTRV